MDKLLPCPFCNGEADYNVGNNGTNVSSDHLIACENEDCFVQPSLLVVVLDEEPSDKASKIWNTRAHPAPRPFADLLAEGLTGHFWIYEKESSRWLLMDYYPSVGLQWEGEHPNVWVYHNHPAIPITRPTLPRKGEG